MVAEILRTLLEGCRDYAPSADAVDFSDGKVLSTAEGTLLFLSSDCWAFDRAAKRAMGSGPGIDDGSERISAQYISATDLERRPWLAYGETNPLDSNSTVDSGLEPRNGAGFSNSLNP